MSRPICEVAASTGACCAIHRPAMNRSAHRISRTRSGTSYSSGIGAIDRGDGGPPASPSEHARRRTSRAHRTLRPRRTVAAAPTDRRPGMGARPTQDDHARSAHPARWAVHRSGPVRRTDREIRDVVVAVTLRLRSRDVAAQSTARSDGSIDGSSDGSIDGSSDGSIDGSSDGSIDGSMTARSTARVLRLRSAVLGRPCAHIDQRGRCS